VFQWNALETAAGPTILLPITPLLSTLLLREEVATLQIKMIPVPMLPELMPEMIMLLVLIMMLPGIMPGIMLIGMILGMLQIMTVKIGLALTFHL